MTVYRHEVPWFSFQEWVTNIHPDFLSFLARVADLVAHAVEVMIQLDLESVPKLPWSSYRL